MMGASYKSKKDLKAAIGQPLRYEETSMSFCVVGPSPTQRKWFAEVTMKDGKIAKVK